MAHRKIEVDIDDEDQFIDDEAGNLPLSQQEAHLLSREPEVRSYLSKGNLQQALVLALENPPTGVSAELNPLKLKSTRITYDVLSAARPNDIPVLVKSLNSQQIDVLFKYIYRAMAAPDTFNSSILLAWHEKVFEVGGHGSIVRVLTDRRVL